MPKNSNFFEGGFIRKKHCPHYNSPVERKVFWVLFIALGIIADVLLPLWWSLVATIPIAVASWWIAYRSDWF